MSQNNSNATNGASNGRGPASYASLSSATSSVYSQPTLKEKDLDALLSNPEDLLEWALHDPSMFRMIEALRSGDPPAAPLHPVLQHLMVSGPELHGPVLSQEVRQRAAYTAAFGTLAQGINLVLTCPVFSVISGPLIGGPLAVLLFATSNLTQKMAVRDSSHRMKWSKHAFTTYLAISALLTALSPHGTALLLFRHDLNNALAEEVALEFANAGLTAQLEAAQDMAELAQEKQQECDELTNKYEELKNAGNPAYDNFYRQAFGPWTSDVDPSQWASTPTVSLPACPAANRMKIESDTALLNAKDAIRAEETRIRQEFGDDYVSYLEAQKPELYEAYFRRGTFTGEERIRSGTRELGEATNLIFSGKSGPLTVMVLLTLVSLITSGASVYLTQAHAHDPRVKTSWKAWTLFRQEQFVRRLKEVMQQLEGKNDGK
ncbi:hypothetical protein IQ273_02265 [Nodosilinea sp. LEGE 07298]|uniref:hypothetical protein n=1 Tax=Nodosilinea sp. LEGE 07298 TaxID=2777970 RepID=UPI001880EB0A|nr:hypothetical protein [Nodosilinea sp. LEGE 07298]MBE9108246.1 hypothetical protein [Nodosilinea sp. LEGE 07298]